MNYEREVEEERARERDRERERERERKRERAHRSSYIENMNGNVCWYKYTLREIERE